jgi:hypothetical protein
LRAAERLITQDEYYRTAEEHSFSAQLNAEGWRRPALLKKLRVAFSML